MWLVIGGLARHSDDFLDRRVVKEIQCEGCEALLKPSERDKNRVLNTEDIFIKSIGGL
jgi:hypothetical protein